MEQNFKETLVKKIIARIEQCNDLSLLDLILKLLEKSM